MATEQKNDKNSKWVWAVIFFVILLYLLFDRHTKNRKPAPTPPNGGQAGGPVADHAPVITDKDPCECA